MNPHHIDKLISGYCDGQLSPAELADLERQLKDRPELRQRYLELTALHGSLAWVCAARDSRDRDLVPRQKRPSSSARIQWLVALTVALLAAGWLLTTWLPDSSVPGVARLVEVSGPAELIPDNGPAIPAASGAIASGQTLRLGEDNAHGIVEEADGTRLHLNAATTVRLSDGQNRKLFLSAGLMRAEVPAQPAGGTLVLATPHAEIRAAGATFTCSVGTEATRVETEAGHVQVIRQADGKTIDLPVGTYAISTALADDELTPRTLLAKAVIPRGKIRLSGAALALSPDGQRLATSSHQELAFWNTRTGQREFAMPARREEVGCLAFSADGRRVASGGVEAGLYLWDLEQRRQLSRWDTPLPLRTLTYSFDGRRLASTSHTSGQPGEVQIWDAATGQDRRLLTGSILSLAFSPDGQRLAGASQDRGVLIWDAAAGKELAMLKSTPKKERVELVAYSADGRWLAAALHGKGIRLWDAATLTEKWFFPALGRQHRSLALSPDGRTLAAGSQDGTLFFWDLDTGAEIMSQKVDQRAVRLLAFAADGATLTVVGESGALQQWGVSR